MTKKSNTIFFPVVIVILLLVAGVTIYGMSYLKNNKTATNFPTVDEKNGSVIAGFPNFPIYPSSTVVSSQKTRAYGTQPVSYQAYLSTTDSVSKVITWYTNGLQKLGWTIERPADYSQTDDLNIVIKKAETTATVNVEHEDNNAYISIYIQ